MAKPPRSPLVGYNHNLTHLGRVFHIQTEDSGPVTPRLFTHLFFEGTILASKKHEYDAALPDDKVRALMQAQHKAVMKDLVRARLDAVILPFFAARGDELVRPPVQVQGAVPSAPLSETPGPVMVLPEVAQVAPAQASSSHSDPPAGGAFAAAGAAPDVPTVFPEAPSATTWAADAASAAPPEAAIPVARPAGPRRTATRAFEPVSARSPAPAPAPVVVRAPDVRRSPFVRSGPPATSRLSSADGVVVQRNLVVGSGAAASSRPARIRPPVPYVVSGGGHPERPPRSGAVAASAGSQVIVASPAGGVPVTPAATTSATMVTASPLSPLDSGHRGTGAFGVGLAEDKSLDEVILEYLSEDGEPGEFG